MPRKPRAKSEYHTRPSDVTTKRRGRAAAARTTRARGKLGDLSASWLESRDDAFRIARVPDGTIPRVDDAVRARARRRGRVFFDVPCLRVETPAITARLVGEPPDPVGAHR